MSVKGLWGRHVSTDSLAQELANAPLKPQRNQVDDVHVRRDEESRRALVPSEFTSAYQQLCHPNYVLHSPKRARRKAHRAPHIHRVPQHIEREALHPVVHQDPKVVAEEGAGDAERPGRGDDEELAEAGEGGGDDEVKRLKRARREGNFHEMVLDVKVKGKHDKFA